MKLVSLSALALLLFTAPAFSQIQLHVGDVKLGKVQPSLEKTPEFQVTGSTPKRSKNRQWLEIEVEYETKPEEIPELSFKFSVMIEKHLIDGDVAYINIPKERDHYAVMYIPPRTLEKLTGGHALTPASIENVWVEVSFSGQVLDKASFKQGLAMPNLQHSPGLLTKDLTPFAPLYFDRYETQKPGGAR